MTDEHYQDGIKLPTDKDFQEMECVNYSRGTFYIERFKVNGGYIYARRDFLSDGNKNATHLSSSMCFVPDNKPELSEDDTFILMNKVSELSMKLNKMQDSLREFEKEKVDPIRNKLEVYNSFLEGQLSKAKERIQKLEEKVNKMGANFIKCYKEEFNPLRERINKLADHHIRQIDENRKVFNHLDAHDY